MKINDIDFDAMPARKIYSRWILTTDMTLKTAAHFGGIAESVFDMPVLRCPRTDKYLLPGTSIAGALRSYLLDRLTGFRSNSSEIKFNGNSTIAPKTDAVSKLFGCDRDDSYGSQSILVVFDALGSLQASEIRDGVMINMSKGTAVDHKKFDFELIPPGTVFPLRFDLIVPEKELESELLSILCLALEGLDNNEISVGMRKSRGLGQICCNQWKALSYDLSTADGWLEWCESDYEDPCRKVGETKDTALDAVVIHNNTVYKIKEDNRKKTVITLSARLSADILIRAPSLEHDAPDVTHLRSGNKAVVSGSSIAGVIRAHALKIVQLVHSLSRREAERLWVSPLFGPREEHSRIASAKRSRLVVYERFIKGGNARRDTRIAIDRFTQGVVENALFDEQTHVGGEIELQFDIHNPENYEIGLLLLVLKDLATSRLPLGGSSSVGRGFLEGKRIQVSGEWCNKTIELLWDSENERNKTVPDCNQLDDLVNVFIETKKVNEKSEMGDD
jgi:CRISPR/Cas system CSM-associated protein Csm3 (group 7 of RAMP superfamily)